jgi:hypothetical protein
MSELQEHKFVGELNLKQSTLTFPSEFKLAGKGIFYKLLAGRIDVFLRGYDNPTLIVGTDNVLKIPFRQPFKTYLGLSYGKKYQISFVKSKGPVLNKEVTMFKGTIL